MIKNKFEIFYACGYDQEGKYFNKLSDDEFRQLVTNLKDCNFTGILANYNAISFSQKTIMQEKELEFLIDISLDVDINNDGWIKRLQDIVNKSQNIACGYQLKSEVFGEGEVLRIKEAAVEYQKLVHDKPLVIGIRHEHGKTINQKVAKLLGIIDNIDYIGTNILRGDTVIKNVEKNIQILQVYSSLFKKSYFLAPWIYSDYSYALCKMCKFIKHAATYHGNNFGGLQWWMDRSVAPTLFRGKEIKNNSKEYTIKRINGQLLKGSPVTCDSSCDRP